MYKTPPSLAGGLISVGGKIGRVRLPFSLCLSNRRSLPAWQIPNSRSPRYLVALVTGIEAATPGRRTVLVTHMASELPDLRVCVS